MRFVVRGRRRYAAAVATLAALLIGGCGGSGSTHHSSAAPPASPATPPTTAATTPARPAVNPFTGLAPSRNRVVAVKVEDTADARPQVGLDHADVVYVEQVEGGLTRLVAVFDTHLPASVGPVRSTRNDDPEILAQYGPIIYVASGGSRAEYRPLNRSNLHAVINDRGAAGFRRAGNRPIPHNLFANLGYIAAKVKGQQAGSIGLSWSRTITNPSTAGSTVSTRVGSTPVVFKWDAHARRYVRYYNGRPDRLTDGHAPSTPNVIVQFVRGNVFRGDIDPAGNPAWYQHTIGSGRAVVFRDGRRIESHWSRAHATDGTHLTDAHGKPVGLAPGGEWFVLVNNGTALAAG